MREIKDVKELRALQMQIMDIIDEFCKKNHLTYSLAGGTLIGAIRHKGYIPWDDDIDIYMLRKDYDIFLRTFDGFNPRYKTFEWHDHPKMEVLFAKVGDLDTRLSEQGTMREYGVYVDIFPLDGVSKYALIQLLVFKMKTALYILSHAKTQPFSHQITLKNKVRWCVSRLWPFSKKFTFNLIDNIARKWPRSKNVTNIVSMGTSNPYDQFDIESFGPTIPAIFEDRQYQIMKGYDKYLRKRFGNYMVLPPESKRIQAHDLIAYIKD